MSRRKEPAIPNELLDQLLSGGAASAAFEQGGLLDALKKALTERALHAEMDHHLAGDDGAGNTRNGYGRKTVTTETGAMAIEVPRDRQSSFDPQLIAKYQRRFPGFDDKIVSMYARGMSTREIAGHLRELYGIDVSPDLISTVTDAVLDEVATWQQRPLDPVYPLVFFDAIRVKIRDEGIVRNKAIHIALGVRADGAKEVLGLWLEQNEGAKFWLRVMNELKNRGTEDILLAVVDGLKGFPDAITAVFPETVVQTCIVHLLRNSMDFVSWKDRKGLASALKQIYRATDADAAEKALVAFDAGFWGQRYPAIGQSWRRAWSEVIPFFAFPDEVRRIVYTTNAIEALNSKLRRAVRARGHFPSDDAATNSAFSIWGLKDWADRDRSQNEIKADIQNRLTKVAGVEALVFAPPSLPGAGGGLPISMVIQSTGDPSQVYEIAEQIKQKAQASGRFIVVQNSLNFDAPQVTVTVDRDRAAALNVPISDIGTTLGLLVGGAKIAQFDRDSNSYDIIPQVPDKYRNNPEKLGDFYIRSVSGEMVPLSAVVKITTNASPSSIDQFNQLNSATISALPVPGVTTGTGLQTIEDIARPLLPTGFFTDYSGQSRLEKEQGSTIIIAFALAVVVIYLVLAAQFESFRDPLIIMMSVPLSIFGAIIPLNLGLGTLNIYTQVGLITLIGLITKHGILLVEFANQQREEHGLSRSAAIIASAKVRLRPILMTTAAMALGVVPLILAAGAGAAARYSMGLVIFSGILIGTTFTLFVVPMFYTFLSAKDVVHRDGLEHAPAAEPVPHA